MYLEDIFTSLERKFPYAFVYSLHSLKKNTSSFRFSKQANLEEVMKIISQVVGNCLLYTSIEKSQMVKVLLASRTADGDSLLVMKMMSMQIIL